MAYGWTITSARPGISGQPVRNADLDGHVLVNGALAPQLGEGAGSWRTFVAEGRRADSINSKAAVAPSNNRRRFRGMAIETPRRWRGACLHDPRRNTFLRCIVELKYFVVQYDGRRLSTSRQLGRKPVRAK